MEMEDVNKIEEADATKVYEKARWHMKELNLEEYEFVCGCLYSNLLLTKLSVLPKDHFIVDDKFSAEKFAAYCQVTIGNMEQWIGNILNLACMNYVQGKMKDDNDNTIGIESTL